MSPGGTDQGEPLVPPPLGGRELVLRALDPGDYAPLRGMELHGISAHTYRHRSAVPSPEQFARSMWEHVLVNFAVVSRGSGQLAGNVVCYNADFRNGHAHISVLLAEAHRGPAGTEIVEVFIGYLFGCFDFRKLYADVLEPNLAAFAGTVGPLFETEAHHRGDIRLLGRFVDRFVLALWRERWDDFTAGPSPHRPAARLSQLLQEGREPAG